MRIIAAALALLILIASPLHAQTLTPQDARATLTMARAQATAASELATANAPTATMPATMTPQPTSTSTPTPAPTQTPQPTNTATAQPSATSAATATMTPSATATREMVQRGRTIYDDWPLLLLLGIGALAMVIVAWRLIDGKTITLPRRGRNDDA